MYYIGVDLGGTNIAVGIVDENYNIVKKGSVPTMANRDGKLIIRDMADLCLKLVEEADLTMDDIAYAGVATPGTANSADGVVEYANNLPFVKFPLAALLGEYLGGKKVYIENDANAAAKAEAIAGVAKGEKFSVMITLGTGLGGGVILDGQVLSGFNFAGAELGHTVVVRDGRQCTCGRKGCWETYSSATGLVRSTKEKIAECIEKGIPSLMIDMVDGDPEKASARTAFSAMKQGDKAAAEVVDDYITVLAIGIGNMINIFAPNVLSIGGGICNEGDNLLVPLKEKVAKEVYTREGYPSTEIKIATLGNDAGILGAAVLGL